MIEGDGHMKEAEWAGSNGGEEQKRREKKRKRRRICFVEFGLVQVRAAVSEEHQRDRETGNGMSNAKHSLFLISSDILSDASKTLLVPIHCSSMLKIN